MGCASEHSGDHLRPRERFLEIMEDGRCPNCGVCDPLVEGMIILW